MASDTGAVSDARLRRPRHARVAWVVIRTVPATRCQSETDECKNKATSQVFRRHREDLSQPHDPHQFGLGRERKTAADAPAKNVRRASASSAVSPPGSTRTSNRGLSPYPSCAGNNRGNSDSEDSELNRKETGPFGVSDASKPPSVNSLSWSRALRSERPVS